jgi:phosphoribosylaminoimidazole carboxylase PurE protein
MKPLVSIIMGSTSDLPVMEKACKWLNDNQIPFEVNALSAHRTPDAVESFAKGAKERGVKVIIAAAGMAAALPGVIAASTPLPVIGVPIKGMLDGLDAMLSIIQMPPGIPVATVGVNAAQNAAILAADSLLIHLYRLCQGWTSHELGRKERRLVPYIISIVCYFACFFWMEYRNTPRVISIIVVVALTIQMVCALINIWWKISTHTAAIGGVAGGLVSYSIAFSFNPLWWLCFVLILAGAVGTARMILRQHSLSQVVTGFLVGAACAILVI